MTKNMLPKVISQEIINLQGLHLTVCILDNGQRVIDANSLEEFFTKLGFVDTENQEVRIRLLEDIASKIDNQFETINKRIDEKFKAQRNFIGLIMSVVIVPVLLHHYGLI